MVSARASIGVGDDDEVRAPRLLARLEKDDVADRAICQEIVSPSAACVTVSPGPNWISMAWRNWPTIETT
jgi:hypothetical protein